MLFPSEPARVGAVGRHCGSGVGTMVLPFVGMYIAQREPPDRALRVALAQEYAFPDTGRVRASSENSISTLFFICRDKVKSQAKGFEFLNR
jgi:hypothetical protein